MKSIVLMLLVCLTAAQAQAQSFTLVKDGKPVVPVVVSGTHPAVLAALNDLLTYVQRISGASLEVVHQPAYLTGPALYLGDFKQSEMVTNALKEVKVDGFVLAFVEGSLVIASPLPEGIANGVYTILQEQFGVRWFFPGPLWEIVPTKPSLAITAELPKGQSAVVNNPAFLGRANWNGVHDSAFSRRMRLTQAGVKLPYTGSTHALENIVPPDKYFADHPEYFSYGEGAYHKDNPNFTHPDMPEIFMNYVREKAQAGAKTILMGVNDSGISDQSPASLALDGNSEPYMGMWNASESYFQLIEKVAKQTKAEFPDIRIGCFAYQQVTFPPKSVKHVGDNVDIQICQDTTQEFDPRLRAINRRMVEEWVQKAGGVSFFDYLSLDDWTPRYFPHLVADKLQHAAKLGVMGYGTCGVAMPDSCMPLYYLTYQFLWNPMRNPDELIGQMITDLYGEAAEPIARFYAHWEKCWLKPRKPVWLYGNDNSVADCELYSLEDFEAGAACLNQAMALARQEPVRQRIQFLQDQYAFSLAAGRVHHTCKQLLTAAPPTAEAALALANSGANAWQEFIFQMDQTSKFPGALTAGDHSAPFRLRYWMLRDELCNGVLAPLVRWVLEHEGTVDPQTLRTTERNLAAVGAACLEIIQATRTDLGATWRPAIAEGLLTADAPARRDASASSVDWSLVPEVQSPLPWLYRAEPPDYTYKPGSIEERQLHYVPPVTPIAQAVHWKATWDYYGLALRVEVEDHAHILDVSPEIMWTRDSLQVALTKRDAGDFSHGEAKYKPSDVELGVGLYEGKAVVYCWHPPYGVTTEQAGKMVKATVVRNQAKTIYELSIDWALVQDFKPQPEHSLGLGLVVNDFDGQARRIAEYGTGMSFSKRPERFGALRLTEAR